MSEGLHICAVTDQVINTGAVIACPVLQYDFVEPTKTLFAQAKKMLEVGIGDITAWQVCRGRPGRRGNTELGQQHVNRLFCQFAKGCDLAAID